MLNVRLADDHMYGKLLFTWLSLEMSLMVPFFLSLFPRDVLDKIWDLIESVFEGFPVYFPEQSDHGLHYLLRSLCLNTL